jgi:hypothetical protein
MRMAAVGGEPPEIDFHLGERVQSMHQVSPHVCVEQQGRVRGEDIAEEGRSVTECILLNEAEDKWCRR